MKDNSDNLVKNLQGQIYEHAQDYDQVELDRWLNPRFRGHIDKPDGYACLTGKCGDSIEIFLKFENNRVKKASFKTDGCSSSAMCGSFAAEMAIGKDPDQLLAITGDTISEKFQILPEDEKHCAFLAGETLQEALNDYMIKQRKVEF